MHKYPLAIFSDHPEVHFEYRTAVRLARVSEEFIHQCEREELITSRITLHGTKGLCYADVCKLKLIRHLHEDLGLDLEAVDFVLRYRNRIQTIQRRLDEMEQRMRQMEQEHLNEILALRRRLAKTSVGNP
jgi:hypothetical protein